MAAGRNGSAPGRTQAPKPTFDEIGTVGVPIWAGRISDEWQPLLQGDLAPAQYREMADDDPVVGSFLYGIEQLTRKVDWNVVPAEGDKSTEYADFVRSCLHDMEQSWHETLSHIFTFLPYGWSLLEPVFKLRRGASVADERHRSKFDDGKVGWRKLAYRRQDTRWAWDVDDETGDIRAFEQFAPPTFQIRTIPWERMLLFRTQAVSPEGRSILRNSWSSWRTARGLRRVEAIGAERDNVGIPKATAPPTWFSSDASTEEKQALAGLLDLAQNLRKDELEGFVIPAVFDDKGNKLVDIELMKAPGQRQFDLNQVIGRYDQRIAMPVLADFILLGHEQIGSYNLGGAKIDLFSAALQARLNSVADVMNSRALPRLLRLNGMDVARCPRMAPQEVFEEDLDSLGGFFQRLGMAGAELFPNPELLADLLRRAHIPPDVISAVVANARKAGEAPAVAPGAQGSADGAALPSAGRPGGPAGASGSPAGRPGANVRQPPRPSESTMGTTPGGRNLRS